ncbi:MAG: KTSC domain-containing protein [Rhodocyclales bacterium]|nr:KTSC domain-containing protein [Rhodocyclales bacterium]
MRGHILGIAIALTIGLTGVVHAETVNVKYRGPVDLAPFQCVSINRSSLVTRVCYDRKEQYMVIGLQGTYYHYCEIDPGTVSALRGAQSMGRFFNSNIKGRFDCRMNRVPTYK